MREWLAFHLDVQGATKVVIYDDNAGRDGLREVAAAYGERVIVHDLATMPEFPDRLRPENLELAKNRQEVGGFERQPGLTLTRHLPCRPSHSAGDRCGH